MRTDGRRADELRPIRMLAGFQKTADGSVLLHWGETVVLCAASVDESVPPFRGESGGGWLTAEYTMLPGSTSPREPTRHRIICRLRRPALRDPHGGMAGHAADDPDAI